MYKIKKIGFSLSEVLITLVVIGIISAIAIPIMINNYKWKQYRTGFLKAKSILEQSVERYRLFNGSVPECGYWLKNPYGSAKCVTYSSSGSCSKYQLSDGSDLPTDYNGNFSDCKNLYDFFLKDLNVVKKCDSNAYSGGCIPKYEGNDSVYSTKNEDASDYDVNKSLSGCSGWYRSKILSGKAFVTADGIIYFPYSGVNARILAVDVNGFRGPNKWGHDIHVLMARMADVENEPKYYPGGCEFLEYGGISGKKLLYNKKYM